MNENKINVEKTNVYESQKNVKKYGLNNSDCALTVSFHIKVVKFKQISRVPILFYAVNNCNKNKI